jgi:large subunit ribosomal protein L15
MRGQLANSPGMRVGFEGGQMPLYRRLPKLRGIAGGMPAGRKSHVTVNLADIVAAVEAGKLDAALEISLAVLKEKGLLKATGRERKLPLKVLAEGEMAAPLKIKANAFSAAAAEKISAAGGEATVEAGKAKWTRGAHERRVRAAATAEAAPAKGKKVKKA